jgi:ABC-type lipoprotein release transport system permease subunit
MGYIFFQQSTTGNSFGMDGASVASALGLVYGAVLLVTLAPAWRASRLPPAEAVRYSE